MPAVERHKALTVIYFCILIGLVAVLHKSRPPFAYKGSEFKWWRRQPGLPQVMVANLPGFWHGLRGCFGFTPQGIVCRL